MLFEPELAVYRGEQWARVFALLKQMPKRAQRVIYWRYAAGLSLRATADELGMVSTERVRQIEAKALRLLGHAIRHGSRRIIWPEMPTGGGTGKRKRKSLPRNQFRVWQAYLNETLLLLKKNLTLLGNVKRDGGYLFAGRGATE